MAEREPLLPRQNRPAHQHSIFQLVCHSPWYYIGQRSLLFARSFLALYLSAVLGLAVYYECTPNHRKYAKLFPFYGSTISFAIQVIYYWITAIWTFDHLVGAHSQFTPREQPKGRILANMRNVFSIPKNTNADSKKSLAFSLFYSAATTFPLVVTTTYWLYLFPMGIQPDPLIWPRILQYFVIANFYIINSIIAIVEVMLLSSVQVQKPLGTHLRSIIILCILYIVWVVFGRVLTGQYVCRYFDPTPDWRVVPATFTYISSLAVNVFLFQSGLHVLRERLAPLAERHHRES